MYALLITRVHIEIRPHLMSALNTHLFEPPWGRSLTCGKDNLIRLKLGAISKRERMRLDFNDLLTLLDFDFTVDDEL